MKGLLLGSILMLASLVRADPPQCDPPGLRGVLVFPAGMDEEARADSRAQIVGVLADLADTAMPTPGRGADIADYRRQRRDAYAQALGGHDAMRACEARAKMKKPK